MAAEAIFLYALPTMSLKSAPALNRFLSTYFADTSAETDGQTVQTYLENASGSEVDSVTQELRQMIESGTLAIEEIGSESNRWFGDSEEARDWFRELLGHLNAGANGGAVVVKDSNGAVLEEGDSVQVIKDLKVRGGSSDLKRGTLIKKIHLFGDSENIECRVDGSTLVLKTCFLKKV